MMAKNPVSLCFIAWKMNLQGPYGHFSCAEHQHSSVWGGKHADCFHVSSKRLQKQQEALIVGIVACCDN